MNYNKAVRDKIPEIIEKSGHACNIKTLTNEEFLTEIEKKLTEEVNEFQECKDVSELADILEILYRISELRGTPIKNLEEIRLKKL